MWSILEKSDASDFVFCVLDSYRLCLEYESPFIHVLVHNLFEVGRGVRTECAGNSFVFFIHFASIISLCSFLPRDFL